MNHNSVFSFTGKCAAFLFLTLFMALTASLSLAAEMQACPEDIEEVWSIEDERQESDTLLVSKMFNGDDRLGLDAESSTFYCSIGIEDTADWPELALNAEGEDGLSVMWTDDYVQDERSSAVSRGTRYEFIAYTDTSYAYYGVIFTGLPIVIIDSEPGVEIDAEYVPTTVDISGAGFEAVHTEAGTHLRAGGPLHEKPKLSYRMEFRRTTEKGKVKKNKLSVLGMDADSDWLLLANPLDHKCVCNYLCWKIWNKWNEGTTYLTPLRSQMVEAFVQGEYRGVYELLQRVKPTAEIERIGAYEDSTVCARVIHPANVSEKHPSIWIGRHHDSLFQLRYQPEGMSDDEAFALFDDFAELNEPSPTYRISDEEFAEMFAKHYDVREAVSYFLFMNAVGLSYDNVENNLFLWADASTENITYHISPWDMDVSFNKQGNENDWEVCTKFVMYQRLLDGDMLNSREIAHEIWDEACSRFLTPQYMDDLFTEAQELLNNSGAYLREMNKWHPDEVFELDLSTMSTQAATHIQQVTDYLNLFWPVNGK